MRPRLCHEFNETITTVNCNKHGCGETRSLILCSFRAQLKGVTRCLEIGYSDMSVTCVAARDASPPQSRPLFTAYSAYVRSASTLAHGASLHTTTNHLRSLAIFSPCKSVNSINEVPRPQPTSKSRTWPGCPIRDSSAKVDINNRRFLDQPLRHSKSHSQFFKLGTNLFHIFDQRSSI